MVIQKLLIQYLLMPLARLMEKVPERAREYLFVAGGLGVGFEIMRQNLQLPSQRYLVYFAIGCVSLGIMILATLCTDIKPVRFRKGISICWFGMGFMLLQSALRLNIDYIAEAIIFLVAFPVVFICWNNADRTQIFKLLLRIIKILAVVFMVASLLFAKITKERYQGIFDNPNGAAELLMLTVGCQIVEILYAKKLDWRCLIDILILGCSVAVCYYTNSRTGYLGMIVAVCFAVGMYLLTHDRKENLKCLIRVTATALVTVICVFNLVYVFQWRAKLDIPFPDLSGESTQTSTVIGNSAGVEENNQPTIQKPTAAASDAEISGIESFHSVAKKKGEMEGKSFEQISTGRLTLWTFYASDLNLFGHASVPTVFVPLTGQTIGTPHMVILQFAYESGAFAGIFYFLLNLLSGLLTIGFAWKFRKEKYAVMPLVVTLVFGVGSIMSASSLAMGYLIAFYYYCVLFPVMVHQPEEENIKE